jgi:predicted RNA methylase
MNLDFFEKENLFEATKSFFNELNITIKTYTREAQSIENVLGKNYEIVDSVYVNYIDDNSFDNLDQILESSKYKGILLFSLGLKSIPKRKEIADLTRAFNQKSKGMPVCLLLRYNSKISLALSERTDYKQEWREGEKIGKVIILRDIDTEKPHTGHLRILEGLAEIKSKNFGELHKEWLNVLNIKTLNRNFYEKLVAKMDKKGNIVKGGEGWYFKCLKDIQINLENASRIFNKEIDDELRPQAVIRVIIRLMFIWFMKEKKLIKPDFFTRKFADDFLKDKNTYYNAVLQNMFFAVLNAKISERRFREQNKNNKYDTEENEYGMFQFFRYEAFFKQDKANEFKQLTDKIPFINGGLFTCHDQKIKQNQFENYIIDGFSDNPKDRATISDDIIFELIDLFNSFVFTVEESTPIEQDIALDPELLGTVFENLISFYNPETKENAKKQTGSFYTPREIVDYMCSESLKESLKTTFPDLHSQIDKLIDKNEDYLDFPEKNKMLAAITNLKILDPACGSGAFPMGMFNLMVRTVEKLQERKTTYKNKLDIIKNCIYGVDIQNIAIEISKLRFFISLLVDYQTPEKIEDFDVLPNLETKFIVANTLTGIDLKKNEKLLFDFNAEFRELTKIFTYFTTAKTPAEKMKIKRDFEKKKADIVKNVVDINIKEKILAWNPFNVCYCSPFFDSGIMFGISNGFDIIIGNPPWGADLTKKDKDILKDTFPEIDSSTPNSFAYFVGWAHRNYSCIISYVLPDSILIKDYAKTRELIKDFVYNIHWYENSGLPEEHKPFIYVDHDVCVINVRRDITTNLKYTIHKYQRNVGKIIEHGFEQSKNKIIRAEFEFAFNLIVTENDIKILDKLDAFDCLNKITQCHEGIHTGNCREILFLRAHKTASCKPLFYGGGTGGDIIENYYSKRSGWFVDYRAKIINKSNGMYASLRDEKIFKFPKIYITRTGNPFKAFYNESDYASNNFFSLQHIRYSENTSEFLKQILPFILSKVTQYFIRTFAAPRIGSTFVETKILHLLKIRIPILTQQQKYVFINTVDFILYLKNNHNKSASNLVSNDVIALYLEKVLDACVYELYFEEEIKSQQVDILELIKKSLDNVSSLPIEQQILRLFEEWNDYKNEVRNRIILQETRSESVAQIIKSMSY